MIFRVSFCFVIFNCIQSIAAESNETTSISNEFTTKRGVCRHKNCDSLCLSPKIDAVLNYRNGTIYAFKGNHFYEIMNKSRAQDDSNIRIIRDYWNPNKGIFIGPIDAAFVDNNNYTHLFQNNIIHTFRDFDLIESHIIEAFDRVSAALMVNFKKGSPYIYIFTDINYWKIHVLSTDDKYDWKEMFSMLHPREIRNMSLKFPQEFDVIFQNNQKDIEIITDMKYKTIPIERFPNSIKDEDLIERFIYKDLLNCENHFYKATKFSNYDQFIIDLLKTEGKGRQNCNFLVKKIRDIQTKVSDKTCDKSSNNWFFTIFWNPFTGALIAVLIIYSLKFLNKKRKTSRRDRLRIYPNHRIEDTQNKSINLIRRNTLITEDL